jgi:hypothetical protein
MRSNTTLIMYTAASEGLIQHRGGFHIEVWIFDDLNV